MKQIRRHPKHRNIVQQLAAAEAYIDELERFAAALLADWLKARA